MYLTSSYLKQYVSSGYHAVSWFYLTQLHVLDVIIQDIIDFNILLSIQNYSSCINTCIVQFSRAIGCQLSSILSFCLVPPFHPQHTGTGQGWITLTTHCNWLRAHHGYLGIKMINYATSHTHCINWCSKQSLCTMNSWLILQHDPT